MSIKEQLSGRQYGEIIPQLNGMTVKVVFDRHEGTGQYGPYSLQNGVLADETGEEIKVLFSNLPDAKGLEGAAVNLMATETKKFGFQGVKLVKDEYNGEVKPCIRITKAGYIEQDGSRALYEKGE